MRSKFIGALFLLFILPQFAWAFTGREIMEQSLKLQTPDTAESQLKMLIHDGKRVDEKELTIIGKQYPNNEFKGLVTFHKPTQIKMLTHAAKGRGGDQWVVLSSGKIKRVASGDKGQSFVHSHFYFEDLSPRQLDDYNYEYLGEEKAVDADCHKVQGIKKVDAEKVYDKMIFYVRKSDYFLMRIDFFKDGKLLKYLENLEIKKVDDILTPFRVVMYMADGKDRTEMLVERVEYNKDIADSKFNKEALR